MAYYRTCPLCGCNLDPGESCECIPQRERRDKALAQIIKIERKGQNTWNLEKLKEERGESVVV